MNNGKNLMNLCGNQNFTARSESSMMTRVSASMMAAYAGFPRDEAMFLT